MRLTFVACVRNTCTEAAASSAVRHVLTHAFQKTAWHHTEVRKSVLGLFSMNGRNRGSVQNCGPGVVKAWHPRREAERAGLCFRLRRWFPKKGSTEAGAGVDSISTGSHRKAASGNDRRIGLECRTHHQDVGKDEAGRTCRSPRLHAGSLPGLQYGSVLRWLCWSWMSSSTG